MRTLIGTLVCAAVLTLSGISQAAQIATPMIFGTGEQDTAHCLVLNGGTTSLTVTLRVFDDFGQTVATSGCGSLGAGQFCALRRAIDNAEAHACIATVEGSATSLRGTLVLEEKLQDPVWGTSFYRPVRSAPMR